MTDIHSKIEISRVVEGLIFASVKPVPIKSITPYLGEFEIDEIIALIKQRYNHVSGIELHQISDDHFAFRTHPDIAARLNLHRPVERPLSRAAMEVLSIIAYHQPITRAEIEEIRGISLSRGTIDILLELDWIKPRGRRRTPGRPLTWGTTIGFLDYFGLSDLNDLPGVEELKSAGLLRKGQTLGGLGEQGFGLDASDDDNSEENLNFSAANASLDEENLQDDWTVIEDSYETEHTE
ncbi:MAG: SMC-Scp complex subunit ScpB [Alphaproteobacteria bacterium]|nr:SMC-Scp complex subunit ScpB [Alphaproteobacteria bacterium]